MGLFSRKPLELLLEEMKGEHRLRRVLGPIQLTSLGIGAIIGAGIFVATGAAAHNVGGPALMLSYTFAYATLGELFAWIIGWDLVLEYAVGSATVATGWSGYFQNVLAKLHIILPATVRSSPWRFNNGLF